MNRMIAQSITDIDDNRFYRVADLESVLKNMGLNYSIFTIRDAETYKCINYKNCGRRYTKYTDVCPNCGADIRAPLIASPRTIGGGKGVGHRRYTGKEIKEIVRIFTQRKQ